MSRLIVVPLFFKEGRDGLVPADPVLHSRIIQYCQANLAEVPDLTRYRRTFAVVEYGDHGEIVDIHGVSADRMTPDIGIFRSSGPKAKQATVMLHDRWQSFYADLGWRGEDVFIWVDKSEQPEQQCPNQSGSIKEFDLKVANRMAVRVR